jgi:SAM-dependent methyltransferase
VTGTDDFTAQQRQQWGRAASGWKRWAEVFAQRDDARRYLESGGVQPGHRVVELGAGTGDQTLALAERVGPEGRVVAVDLSEEMLAIARERVAAAGFDNVEFRVADVGRLDLEEDGFDVAVSGFTWMLLREPAAAASRVRDLLAPGGRFVASVWGPPPQAPVVATPMAVIVAELGIEPPDPEGPGLFALADPDRFKSLLEEAGFEDVSVSPFAFRLVFPSPEEFAEFTRDVAIVVSDLVREHAPERSQEIWAKVADAARPQAGEDGSVTFENVGLLGVGGRPA